MKVTIADDEGVVFAAHRLDPGDCVALRHAVAQHVDWRGVDLDGPGKDDSIEQVEEMFSAMALRAWLDLEESA